MTPCVVRRGRRAQTPDRVWLSRRRVVPRVGLGAGRAGSLGP
eukprot:CAMPEP_0182611494 /NCGR_PEP_ID=MMETSP1330-20130603/14210_1 /TAXON_ID=464278 /ORGANISM="Picochlorum sp., Strain RCC944" /LENGTH=41 /DNA_ID= /DNA_START= /DNA_END= /DNA_ORIENTATION=